MHTSYSLRDGYPPAANQLSLPHVHVLFTPNVRWRTRLANSRFLDANRRFTYVCLIVPKRRRRMRRRSKYCPVLFSVISPMPAVVANAPTSAIPTGEPDFVVFSIIAHDADAPATCDHSPPRTNHPYGRIPVDSLHVPRRGTAFMSEERIDQERPCLHRMMVELIDDFFAEYPAAGWRLRQRRYN